jgi:hypothetical protein
MLYPDLSPKAGWERVHRAIQTGKLRAYTIGGEPPRRFVSRAEVEQLAKTLRNG